MLFLTPIFFNTDVKIEELKAKRREAVPSYNDKQQAEKEKLRYLESIA